MKAPKILPWVAHKTGISEELALKLWRRAAGEAAGLAGCSTSSDYYRWAVEGFIDLAEAEGQRSIAPEKASKIPLSWLWRHQSRISKLNLIAAQNLVKLWQAHFRNLLGGQRHAL